MLVPHDLKGTVLLSEGSYATVLELHIVGVDALLHLVYVRGSDNVWLEQSQSSGVVLNAWEHGGTKLVVGTDELGDGLVGEVSEIYQGSDGDSQG